MINDIETAFKTVLAELDGDVSNEHAERLVSLLLEKNLHIIEGKDIFGADSLRAAVKESIDRRTGNVGVSAELLRELIELAGEALH